MLCNISVFDDGASEATTRGLGGAPNSGAGSGNAALGLAKRETDIGRCGAAVCVGQMDGWRVGCMVISDLLL